MEHQEKQRGRDQFIEFETGSAQIDAVDKEEIFTFLTHHYDPSHQMLVIVAFADEPGEFTESTWTQKNIALAKARAQALREEMPFAVDIHARGVAPQDGTTIPSRVDGAGKERFARAVLTVQELPSASPQPVPSDPVPTCS